MSEEMSNDLHTMKNFINMKLRLIIAVIHTTKPVVKFKYKKPGLYTIRTHDLCDTEAVLYQLSYQTIWELVTFWVCNIPVEGEECQWIYEISYIWTVECWIERVLRVAVTFRLNKYENTLFVLNNVLLLLLC